MKKFFALLLTLAVVAGSVLMLASCGSEKEPTIVGEWKLDFYVYTFNEDGTGQYDVAGNVMKFTYETDGDKLSLLFDGNTDAWETTYTIEGNELNVRDIAGKDTIYKRVK